MGPRRALATAALGLLGAVTAGVGVAVAAPVPMPTVSFTAEMHVSVRGREAIVVKLFHTAARLRYEIMVRGQRRIVILDRAARSLTVLDPRRKLYGRRPYTGRADIVAQLPPANATLEKVGAEKVGGVDAVKYKAAGSTHNGRPFSGHIWMTAQNIILRVQGFVRQPGGAAPTTVELRKVKLGEIDAKLFAVPDGYKPEPPPQKK